MTIEDISFVIDTGRAKEKNYDPHLKTSTLTDSWISQASAKQRRGRAGRCKAGEPVQISARKDILGSLDLFDSHDFFAPQASAFTYFREEDTM